MLAFLSRNRSLTTRPYKGSAIHLRNAVCSATFGGRSFSSPSSSERKLSAVVRDDRNTLFTINYLINSCGLTPEKAASASRYVILQNPDRPDSVIRFLTDHGLTKAHISKIVGARPQLLLADSQKTLLPKIEYFASIGIVKSDLGKSLSDNAHLLRYSLKNMVIPNVQFCRNVIGLSGKQTITVLTRFQRHLLINPQEHVAPNVEALRKLGMPQSLLTLLATCHATTLWRNHDSFSETLKIVLEMGYDPRKTNFIQALTVFSGLSDSTREHKMELFKSWGWSEDEVHNAIINYPICLSISDKKLMSVMDFLVNKVGWQSVDVAKYPPVINYSLRNRIIPRCSVVALLLSKGVLKKRLALGSILGMPESCFLEKFVAKYEGDFPDLRSVYQGKMDFDKLKDGPIAMWTFVLVMVYFALGTIISAYGCWMFFRRPTPKIRETDKLLKGEDEGSKLTVTTKAKDGSDATKLQSYYSQIDQQNAGFWGYLMQLIYQTCAGAVIMTDIVFWCILVPTMSNKTITWLIGYMHSLNAFFLLLDTSINNLPFQWLGLAYFVLWTSVYGVFQWAVHICGVTWWPYPFLELSTPWAPLWYFGMAAVHVPFYGIYMLLIKAKFNICSRLFPDAFVRN